MRRKEDRLYPSLRHHSYLVLARRRELLRTEVERIQHRGSKQLLLLDAGGQDKPYAPTFEGRRWARAFRWLAVNLLFPVNNLLGLYLDRWLRANDQFAVNWMAIAEK